MKIKPEQTLFQLLQQIPQGKVTTYKIIADKLNISPRYVGRLIHNNPDPKKYPCHRVVRSDGTLASGYAFGGPTVQQKQLINEGVKFNNNKINLNKYCLDL